MKFLKHLVLGLLLCCSPLIAEEIKDIHESEEVIDKIAEEFSQLLRDREQIYVIGTRIIGDGRIEFICHTDRFLKIDDSRVLIVNCVDGFIDYVNQHPSFQKWANDVPLEINKIIFSITHDGVWYQHDFQEDQIAFIYCLRNRVGYSTWNNTNKVLNAGVWEYYNSAVKKVKKSNQYNPVK